MTKREIYKAGYNRGKAIASWVDLPEKGSIFPRYLDWVGHGDTVETLEAARDLFMELAYRSEANGRDFSPFEFTAHDLNELEETKPYDVWEVFDEGIEAGIRADMRLRLTRKWWGKD